jgi:hypothetical protein
MRRYEGPVGSKPHMERSGADRLAQLMSGAKNVFLEYGSGASTMLAGNVGIPVIISTESDAAYCELVRSEFAPKYPRSTLISFRVDIGPTGEWGHPRDRQKKDCWPLYAFKQWRFVLDHGFQPDLVLIDGRFRTACVFASLLFARVDVPILVDDYVGRDYSKAIEPIIKPAAMYGRMAEFVVPRNRDALIAQIVCALPAAFDDPN